MPTYVYQCDCGLQFEAVCSRDTAKNPKPCKACGALAPQCLPTSISGVFKATAQGVGPQNTGVHSFDTNYDRVIGQSAQQGWSVIERRVADKKELLKNNDGSVPEDVSRNLDGSYRLLDSNEKGVHQRALSINSAIMQKLVKRKGG